MRHPDLGPLLSFRGPLGNLWISGRSNVVYYAGTVLPAAAQPVKANEWLDIARRFVERHVDEFASRNFALQPAQVDAISALIRWIEQPRPNQETAIFRIWVELKVELPAGRVMRFSASDLRLVRTTPPAVPEARVRTIVKAKYGRAAVEDIELVQLPKDGGRSSFTAWNLSVMRHGADAPVTEQITIDADTGEIVPD